MMGTAQSISGRRWYILPVIILSQFAGGSLWFSGNAILADVITQWKIEGQITGYITSAVQLGFIAGTLLFAIFTLSDRYSPRKVFFYCTVLGAVANSLFLFFPGNVLLLIVLRFCTGFFLAGIYPVGMKIASGWFKEGLGEALGLLVGALVLGTAFPHFLQYGSYRFDWRAILVATSLLAISGGFAMCLLVPDGPYLQAGTSFKGKQILSLFHIEKLRGAACGYFGHMWELYAFWAFLPLVLAAHPTSQWGSKGNSVALWSFIIIGSGAAGCYLGGKCSRRIRSERIAFGFLAISGACCLFFPLMFHAPPLVFLAYMLVWGICVVGDSPQFSTIIAQNATKSLVGTALTFTNCVGFFVTILSIQLLDYLVAGIGTEYLFVWLLPGPLLGLYSMRRLIM
jgi:MFS family permease